MRKITINLFGMLIFLSIVIFVFVIPMVHAIPILVNIKESLEGYFPYFNYTTTGNIIQIQAVWENIGSVTCDTYLRLKVITNKKTDNFWSNKVNVPPGDSGTLKVFAYLPKEQTKNITIIPYFYYCNELKELSPISLIKYNTTNTTIHEKEEINKTLSISYYLYNKEKMNISFKINVSNNSNEIKEIYIIPSSPFGWILPTHTIPIKNKTHFSINYSFYKPERSPCCNNFVFALKDKKGNFYFLKERINLTYSPPTNPKTIPWKTLLFYGSVFLNILFLLLLAFFAIRQRLK